MKKNNGKRMAVLLLALMMVLGCAIGGTLAWLIAESGTVTNTFTVGNIKLKLEETGAIKVGETENYANDSFTIVPGTEEGKDVKVTVEKGSEACWLFVKIVENNNYIGSTDTPYITWTADTAQGWTLLSKTPDTAAATVTYVYYINQADLSTAAADAEYSVLTENKVSYSSNLTKADLNALGSTKPTLSFKAYAIQSEGLTKTVGDNQVAVVDAADAWALINP